MHSAAGVGTVCGLSDTYIDGFYFLGLHTVHQRDSEKGGLFSFVFTTRVQRTLA
jgi:hypothetical protein